MTRYEIILTSEHTEWSQIGSDVLASAPYYTAIVYDRDTGEEKGEYNAWDRQEALREACRLRTALETQPSPATDSTTPRVEAEAQLRLAYYTVLALAPNEGFDPPELTWNEQVPEGRFRHTIRFDWLRRDGPPEPCVATIETETPL